MMKRMNRRQVGLQEIGKTDLVVRNALRKTSRAYGLRCNAHDISNSVRPDLSHTRAMLHQAVTQHISQRLPRAKAGCAIDVAARLPATFAVGLRNPACTLSRLIIFGPHQ